MDRTAGGIAPGIALCIGLCLGLGAGSATRAETPLLSGAPMFRHIGRDDGLPSNHIYQLAQDRAGYLWIATGDGLARYDGVSFRVWQHDPADPGSLPANNVQSLHVDAHDRIWVGTEGGGLSLLQPDHLGFRNFRAATDARFALDDVWSIVTTPDGAVWFGGYSGGLFRFDPERDRVTRYRHDADDPHSLVSDNVIALAVRADASLWVGTTAGLDRFDGASFGHYRAGVDGLASDVVFTLTPEPDGSMWIGTIAGLDRLDPDGTIGPAAFNAQLPHPRVNGVIIDRRGARWFATKHGIARVDGDSVSRFLDAPLGESTTRLVIQHAMQDHEGGLWFATLGGGLQRLPPNWRNFGVIAHGAAEHGGLSAVFPHGIAEADDAGLWVVGTDSVLDHIDASGRATRHLQDSPQMPDKRLWSVQGTGAGDGSVWIGEQMSLARYEPHAGRLVVWRRGDANDAPPAGLIDQLRVDRERRLWLSANGAGLQLRAPDGRVLGEWLPGEASGLNAGDTEAMELDPDGRLVIAGSGGLLRFDPATERFVPMPGGPTERVFGIDFAADGSLWLQRLGGVEHYRVLDDRLELIERVDSALGMPAVEAGGLRIDNGGQVWITTPRGLWRYRPGSRELRQFGVQDGLPDEVFANRPPLITRAGRFVAGTTAGLVTFDPLRIERNHSEPRFMLESASVRRAGAVLDLDIGAPILLGHDDRELRVTTRLLSFADPQSNRYRFRLRGYEPDWISVGASGERVFSQLPPGGYTLQMVAANADGVWSAPPLTREITVAPPWWRTTWAQSGFALAALLVLVMLGLLYRQRLRRLHAAQLVKRQHDWALRASEAKSSFLATLGHEIRTPMTGVLGMAELLSRTALGEKQRGYATAIQRSGEMLLRLVNDALDLARIEAGRMELADAPLDLHATLHDVQSLLQPLAQRKQLGLSLSIDPHAPRWVSGDALRLKQIVLNLGSNAIKFTAHGDVRIALQAPAHASAQPRFPVVIAVRDTGPGLDPEQQARLFQRFSQITRGDLARHVDGSGLGLAICQELAAAMGGRIELQSEPGSGSEFRLCLPLPEIEAPAAGGSGAGTVDELHVSARGRRLLLVEDTEIVAQVVSGLLRELGHTCVHVPHALAALAELARAPFDLVLLDLDLPGIDGIELMRLIRTTHPRLPAVALTARSDERAEPDARAAGMAGFLRKPVSLQQLGQAIDACLCE